MSIAPASIAIRPPRKSDARPVADCHAAAWREAYLGILPGPTLEAMIARRGSVRWARTLERRSGIRVVEFAGKVAGYASFGPARNRLGVANSEIYEIYLLPEFQGIGLGRRLFKEAREAAVKTHGKGLVVWSLTENERARAFYEALGGRLGPAASERLGERTYQKISYLWP